jgi:uncharacterized protein YkwD
MSVFTSARRIVGVLVVLAVFGLALMPQVGAAPERQLGPRRAMLALTNEDRAAHDRDTLDFAARLARYAKRHSRAMANEGYLHHSTDAQLQKALEDYDWEIGGENVGLGSSLESLEGAFMDSDLHRANILRETFEHAAVGIVREDGHIWITVIFYG